MCALGGRTPWTAGLRPWTRVLHGIPAGTHFLNSFPASFLIFNKLRALPLELPSSTTSVTYSHTRKHNANNLPLWTWWQPYKLQLHSPPLTSRAKGMLPLSSCSSRSATNNQRSTMKEIETYCSYFQDLLLHNANNALCAPPEPVPPIRRCSTIRWCINNPQLLPEVFKRVPGQWFGENISNLFLGRNILQLDFLFKHLFPEKMVLDWYVLGFWMHNRILWDADCTCVIT